MLVDIIIIFVVIRCNFRTENNTNMKFGYLNKYGMCDSHVMPAEL